MGEFKELRQQQEQIQADVQRQDVNRLARPVQIEDEWDEEEDFDQPEEVQEEAPAPVMEEPVRQRGINRKEQRGAQRRAEAARRKQEQAEAKRRKAEQKQQILEQKRRIAQAKQEAKERLRQKNWEKQCAKLGVKGLFKAYDMTYGRRERTDKLQDRELVDYETLWRRDLVKVAALHITLGLSEKKSSEFRIEKKAGMAAFDGASVLLKRLQKVTDKVGNVFTGRFDPQALEQAMPELERIEGEVERLMASVERGMSAEQRERYRFYLTDYVNHTNYWELAGHAWDIRT